MTTRNEIRNEITAAVKQNPEALEIIIVKKIKDVSDYTQRPLIIYVSDFLNQMKQMLPTFIDWTDKEGIAEAMEGISGDKVDIFIHSPGGLAEAAQSVVEIIRSKFNS